MAGCTEDHQIWVCQTVSYWCFWRDCRL